MWWLSIVCGAAVSGKWVPRAGLSWVEYAAVMNGVGGLAILLACVNAVYAISVMAMLPEMRKSRWLYAAVFLPMALALFMPAFGSA